VADVTAVPRLPRPPAPRQVKTSVRVTGDLPVDVFYAMCALRGLRPSQLVAELVADAITAAGRDPAIAGMLAGLAESRAARAAADAGPLAAVVTGPWPGSARGS
jgi:hypothetical protein